MGTYLMMLYVSLEQEVAVKHLFTNKGWGYNKPDLRMMTGDIGPLMEETVQTKATAQAPSQELIQTHLVVQKPQEMVQTQSSVQASHQTMEHSDDVVQPPYQEMPPSEIPSEAPSQQQQHTQSVEIVKRSKRTPKRNPKYEESAEDSKSVKKITKTRLEKRHPKVEVDIDKSNKDVKESSEFQEIIQEAEMIAKSLSNIENENYAEHKTLVPENETDNAASGQFKVKLEQYTDGDDIADFDTQVNDNTAENSGEIDIVPSSSKTESEAVSVGTSASRTSSSKKRKLTGKIVASQGETKMTLTSYSSTIDCTSSNRSNTTHKKEKMYMCKTCGYKSSHTSNLLRHERNQHGNECFDCSRCNKTFRSPATLKSHLQSHDSLEVCQICGKQFSSKSGLKFHTNKVHLSIALFKCSICNKSFQTRSNYDGHVNAHKGYKPYRCSTCIKSFSYRSSLNFHVKHCSRAASYGCSSCNSVFKTETLLAQHTLGKHGGQIFTCGCGKRFKWRTSMTRHQNMCAFSVTSPDQKFA